MKIERPQVTRADAAQLRNTVWKLTAATHVFTVAVVIAVACVWWFLLHRLIRFGKQIDYSGLEALGPQIASLIKQYNPFFWWAIVALCSLIIAYFLAGFVQAMNRRAGSRHVSAETIARLADTLTPPAVGVLQWSWQNRREPITVGVLQRAVHELRSGRAAKIALAQSHDALLGPVAASDPAPLAAETPLPPT